MPADDSLILKLSVAKNLIDQDLAKEVYQQCQTENRSAIELLISRGVLTPHIAENLVKEAERAQGPKTIGGFRIVSKLGQGGMGAVYKAVQLSMDREVALKVIAPEFAKDKAACDRFIREARAAGRINHPNVITCYDAGQDGNVLYMAMELVLGGDADQLAKAGGGRLSEKRAVEIILASAKGLQAIHQAGLLHRDIKPANIFLSQDGVAKLADLGLARSQQGDDKMTVTGAAVGTPAFMSPEQADGADDIDIRSDIYALGATLYALTVGRAPFRGASPWAVVAAVLKDPFPHPRTANPDLSEALADLILKACARDRAERYQTPQELIAALEALAQTASDTVGTSPALPEIDHGTPRPRSSPTARPGKTANGMRRPVAPRPAMEPSTSDRRPLWPFLLGGALLLGLAGWGIWGRQPAAPTTPQAPAATASQVQAPQAQAAPIPQQASAPVAASAPPSAPEVAPAPTRIAQIFKPYQPATPPAAAPLQLKTPTPAQAQALARFAGRWEPVKVARDAAGLAANDKSNQCILIHPDHLMAHLYQYPQNDSWAVAESELEELGEAGFSIPLVRANGRAMNRLSFRLVEGLLEMTVWDDPKMFDDAKGTEPVTRGEPFRLKRIEPCPTAADWEASFWKQAHGTWFIPRSELHRWPNAPSFISIDRKSRTRMDVWGNSTPLVFDPVRMVVKFSQYDRFRLTSDGLLYLHATSAIPLQRLYQDPAAPQSGVNITHEDIWRLAEEGTQPRQEPPSGPARDPAGVTYRLVQGAMANAPAFANRVIETLPLSSGTPIFGNDVFPRWPSLPESLSGLVVTRIQQPYASLSCIIEGAPGARVVAFVPMAQAECIPGLTAKGWVASTGVSALIPLSFAFTDQTRQVCIDGVCAIAARSLTRGSNASLEEIPPGERKSKQGSPFRPAIFARTPEDMRIFLEATKWSSDRFAGQQRLLGDGRPPAGSPPGRASVICEAGGRIMPAPAGRPPLPAWATDGSWFGGFSGETPFLAQASSDAAILPLQERFWRGSILIDQPGMLTLSIDPAAQGIFGAGGAPAVPDAAAMQEAATRFLEASGWKPGEVQGLRTFDRYCQTGEYLLVPLPRCCSAVIQAQSLVSSVAISYGINFSSNGSIMFSSARQPWGTPVTAHARVIEFRSRGGCWTAGTGREWYDPDAQATPDSHRAAVWGFGNSRWSKICVLPAGTRIRPCQVVVPEEFSTIALRIQADDVSDAAYGRVWYDARSPGAPTFAPPAPAPAAPVAQPDATAAKPAKASPTATDTTGAQAGAATPEKPADRPAPPSTPAESAATRGMLMLYAKDKASLWINGKQVATASAGSGAASLPLDLKVGDLLAVSCTFQSGSGAVSLGWRSPDHLAFASRAERWVQLRGTEADIPGLTADMVAMVQNRPRKAGALSAETKELRDMLGGTPCDALDGGGKQSFLIATCLTQGDLVKIKEKP